MSTVGTTIVHPPRMVDASKLLAVVHEIRYQEWQLQNGYFNETKVLMYIILYLMDNLWSRMDRMNNITQRCADEREEISQRDIHAKWKWMLTDAFHKLNTVLWAKSTGLTVRLPPLLHELLELVPNMYDAAKDMMIKNLPGSSSTSHPSTLRLRKSPKGLKRDHLIASKHKNNISCAAKEVLDNSTNVRMVKASSRLLDVVHNIAYEVTLLYANETEAFELLGNLVHVMDMWQHGLTSQLRDETRKLWEVDEKIRAASPRLWDLTHQLLELVQPDSNSCDKTLDTLIRSLPWRNSRRPFDPLRLIKSSDLKKDFREEAKKDSFYTVCTLMNALHGKNFNEEPLFVNAINKKFFAMRLPDNPDESSSDAPLGRSRDPVCITFQERCNKSLKLD